MLSNRFKGDNGSDCLQSIDGTDFQIPYAGRLFFTPKFRGAIDISGHLRSRSPIWSQELSDFKFLIASKL
jgi:hypothetical protein